MNALLRNVAQKTGLAIALILAGALAAAWLTCRVQQKQHERAVVTQVKTDVQRLGIELMSETAKGSIMGALSLLGLFDNEIKQEAAGVTVGSADQQAHRIVLFERIAEAYGADGVFLVGKNGRIGTSWDSSGKSSTGLDVEFRPYFQMALQGKESVYAAVSLARDDRVLYFSTPIRIGNAPGSEALGALVARSRLDRIDALLRGSDMAFLLSPQGVIFASNHKEWLGYLVGEASPERVQTIRALKQFGNQFETVEPSVLPISLAPGAQMFRGQRYALASSRVPWNDPHGDWQVVLMRDITQGQSGQSLVIPVVTAFLVGVAGILLLLMLRGQHRQLQSVQQIDAYARSQQSSAERKAGIAAASIRLQQATTPAELARIFLAEMHSIFGALQGVVYAAAPDGQMTLVARYACGDDVPKTLHLGEGLLGQCAQEKAFRVIQTGPEGFATIRSGLGETPPAAVMMAPVLCHEQLLGVVEIALLNAPGERDCEQFEEMAGLLGMNIEMMDRSLRTQALLETTALAERASAEQLAFQQALIDTIPYPVFYKCPDTRFLGFNRAYEEAFGVDRSDLIGKRVLDLDFLPEADRVAYQSEDETIVANAGKVKRPMRLTLADGKSHETLYSVSGFRKPDGTPGGLVGTFIDLAAFQRLDVASATESMSPEQRLPEKVEAA